MSKQFSQSYQWSPPSFVIFYEKFKYIRVGCPSKLVLIQNNQDLEPKLVSALYEIKRLFQLFRFYTETETFGVSIEPKQTEEQSKQCDR